MWAWVLGSRSASGWRGRRRGFGSSGWLRSGSGCHRGSRSLRGRGLRRRRRHGFGGRSWLRSGSGSHSGCWNRGLGRRHSGNSGDGRGRGLFSASGEDEDGSHRHEHGLPFPKYFHAAHLLCDPKLMDEFLSAVADGKSRHRRNMTKRSLVKLPFKVIVTAAPQVRIFRPLPRKSYSAPCLPRYGLGNPPMSIKVCFPCWAIERMPMMVLSNWRAAGCIYRPGFSLFHFGLAPRTRSSATTGSRYVLVQELSPMLR